MKCSYHAWLGLTQLIVTQDSYASYDAAWRIPIQSNFSLCTQGSILKPSLAQIHLSKPNLESVLLLDIKRQEFCYVFECCKTAKWQEHLSSLKTTAKITRGLVTAGIFDNPLWGIQPTHQRLNHNRINLQPVFPLLSDTTLKIFAACLVLVKLLEVFFFFFCRSPSDKL